MQISREQQVRIMFYATLILLALIASAIFYIIWSDSKDSVGSDDEVANLIKPQQNLETGVLNTKKFQELEKVVPLATTTATTTSGKLTPEQLRAVPRRHSDPFVPFID